MAPKPRIVSGIQPSGKLHVGNYLGAIKNFVDLQESGKYDCFFFIADLHSLSETYDPEQKKQDVYELLASLLALGLDPKKSTIFLQSHIQGHTELAWLFSTVIPVAELERMTQYKDKAARQKSNINTALLTYPVLQAADVLIYNGELVPVGKDQEQHIELIRVIAKKMNAKFGTGFPESKPLFTNAPKIMSLKDPTKKMSKSLGDAHVLNIFDPYHITNPKIEKAVTASDDTTLNPGVENLFKILEFINPPKVDYYRKLQKDGKRYFAELKTELICMWKEFFDPMQEEYKKKIENTEELNKILDEGREKAQPEASQTLNETKQKMGLL